VISGDREFKTLPLTMRMNADWERRGGTAERRLKVDQQLTTMTFGRPTPELPVEDVERAQQHYRDVLGFEIGWLYPGGGIGAVSRDEAVIFFRRRERPFEPAIHWVFAADIDATHEELRARGARIVEPLEKKPWGLRQFTLEDIDGNRFYFHCD
jgi:predicted enzyme related to lactoylglutathione lyase